MPGADNSAALLAARRTVSATKRQAVIDTVRDMVTRGTPVSFSAVARRAGVSAGLVHSPGVKELILAARDQQRATGLATPDSSSSSQVSSESLRQDLAFARDEIRSLREQNAQLSARVRRDLGAQVQALASRDAASRIRDLEERNQSLARSEAAAEQEAQRLQQVIDELRDDLESSRAAHARLMRQVNAT